MVEKHLNDSTVISLYVLKSDLKLWDKLLKLDENNELNFESLVYCMYSISVLSIKSFSLITTDWETIKARKTHFRRISYTYISTQRRTCLRYYINFYVKRKKGESNVATFVHLVNLWYMEKFYLSIRLRSWLNKTMDKHQGCSLSFRYTVHVPDARYTQAVTGIVCLQT